MLGPNAFDDFAKEARSVFVGTRPGEGAQKFVTEVAVAMFNVDELIAEVDGHRCRTQVVVDQSLDVVV